MPHVNGIAKFHRDRGLEKGVEYKGMKHNLHKRDGEEGMLNSETGKVEYESDGKFKDLAKEPYRTEAMDGKNPIYPSVRLDAKNFPELAKLPIGAQVDMEIRAKLVGAEQRDGSHCVDLELREAAIEEG